MWRPVEDFDDLPPQYLVHNLALQGGKLPCHDENQFGAAFKRQQDHPLSPLKPPFVIRNNVAYLSFDRENGSSY
ncbi:hypothetical protein [Microvirga rosea]|uniref:hypothetical protein n=1 Tax=Microvirga rosea TaxID=2715425 RepID=UPI001D0B8BF5|nr:hypothetical protein [Microvirga rosea]MCB8821396.1 hypothetical protein [Microvirga rosea]